MSALPIGPELLVAAQAQLPGTVLPRGFFLVVGLVYLLALGLERLCHRQRIPGAVAILLFGLALQLLVGRAPGINALHVESLHRISLAMLVFWRAWAPTSGASAVF